MSLQQHVFGQDISTLENGVQGIWSTDASKINLQHTWKAQWIWMPDSIQSDVMLARRSFMLHKIPSTALLRITASSKYELYVNGKAICQGPARSAPHHQSFDILDIRSLLKENKNTIAVRVHYQKGTTSYHLPGRAGLLVQLDLDALNSETSIISDSHWKVLPDESWNNNSPAINRFQLVVNDHVNLNHKIDHFETTDFDDSNWLQATSLLRNSGWPAPKKNEKATTLTTPWTLLVPRDIPYLKEHNLIASNLVEARLLQASDIEKKGIRLQGIIPKEISKDFKKNKPLILPASNKDETWFLLYDFGKIINGMPKITIEGEKNTVVNILASPFIIDSIFTPEIVASTFKDQLILSGKKDSWQSMYFKPTRYLAVSIKGNKEALKMHSLGIHQLEYPFELKGRISTPEAPWIEELWNASVKTIDVCTTDAFTDNYRERRQYAQTGYYAALGNYFTYGDSALQRKYLVQVAQEQQANGLMPAYAPLVKDDYMVILDSNCLWIRSLYNYLLYTGDYKTVRDLLPSAQKLMTLLHSYTNELGMLDSPPYSYWLDHTLNDRRGANLTLNGHYLGALDDFSKVLAWLDKDEEHTIFKNKAALLRSSLGSYLWDPEKQLFADAYTDGKRSKQFSEHANAMALACNIATPEQATIIATKLLENDTHNFIKREQGMVMVSPAMSYFLHKGLANYGFEKASLNLLNHRFKHMLHPTTNGTLWEEWWRNGTGRTGKFQERTRSDAQTESVFPPALFTEYILGLQVTKPGMQEITISKPSTSLTTFGGEIPSPLGMVSVQWNLSAAKTLKISIPNGMQAKIDLDSFKSQAPLELLLNGRKIPQNKYITLKAGAYTFLF